MKEIFIKSRNYINLNETFIPKKYINFLLKERIIPNLFSAYNFVRYLYQLH